MNHYETVFILNPVLSEEQIKETVQKFKKLPKDSKSKVVVEEKIVKVKRPEPKKVTVVIREVSYPRMEPINEKVKLSLINEKSSQPRKEVKFQ